MTPDLVIDQEESSSSQHDSTCSSQSQHQQQHNDDEATPSKQKPLEFQALRNSPLSVAITNNIGSVNNQWRRPSLFCILGTIVLTVLLIATTVVAWATTTSPFPTKVWGASSTITTDTATTTSTTIKMATTTTDKSDNKQEVENSFNTINFACIGNSMQYFNDCPRLLEHMLQEADFASRQDSCLRGGASLVSIWDKGNGMQEKFATPNAKLDDGTYDIGSPTVEALLASPDNNWKFVVLNDHTQSPARLETREKTIAILRDKYAPLFRNANATPVFIQTPAYHLANIRNTEDLGDFEHYTQLLQEGYAAYRSALNGYFQQHDSPLQCQVAPVGQAYLEIYQTNKELWHKLYHTDDFHPSPHGTLLQAYILFLVLTKHSDSNDVQLSTDYSPDTYWKNARRMQPPDEPALPLPTIKEAETLRQVALQVVFPEEPRKRKQDASN